MADTQRSLSVDGRGSTAQAVSPVYSPGSPRGIPPKSPVNRGIMSKGTSIHDPSYPGGEKTFLGCFQRVKIDGRRGRGYWEWKAWEGRRMKSGHEGDDEMTSIESDTVGRRSASAPKTPPSSPRGGVSHVHVMTTTDPPNVAKCTEKDQLGHTVPGGVRVLPPFLPYERVPSSPEEALRQKPLAASSLSEPLQSESPVERHVVKSFDQPRLALLLDRAPPRREASVSSHSPPSAGIIPSAPPKELLYADAESKRGGRSQLEEGHGNQLVGQSVLPQYYREKQTTSKSKDPKGSDIPYKGILKSANSSKPLSKSPDLGYERSSQNGKLAKESKPEYPPSSPPDSGKRLTHNKDERGNFSPPSYKYPSEIALNTASTSPSNGSTLSSLTSLQSKPYREFEPETKPLLQQDSDVEEEKPRGNALKGSETGATRGAAGVAGSPPGRSTSLVTLRQPSSCQPKKENPSGRRSGALVWVSQPGGGAKLEWVPTPGLATLRVGPVSSDPFARGRSAQVSTKGGGGGFPRAVVAGPQSGTGGSASAPKGIIKRGDEGGGGGGRRSGASEAGARAGESSVARAASDYPRAASDGNASSAALHATSDGSAPNSHLEESSATPTGAVGKGQHPQGRLDSSPHFESGNPKNAFSSAPGVTRPAGRTNPSTGDATGCPGSSPAGEQKLAQQQSRFPDQEDKIVTVAGRGHGQTVRIRVRPEVHAYLSNLPVIRGGVGSPRTPTNTARRESIHSANSSSASGLTLGSGEGSLGYQEQDYQAVVDEYTLLKKAVDEHDPEALRLLTATEAALSESGGGGSEYPYLREMKERLLISNDAPLDNMADPSRLDPENQLLEVQQTPVGTVVKLNADGYGSHTSPTHRVESFYTGTLESRKTNVHEFFPKNAKTSSFITLSLLYATLLVVVCLGFVLSEVLTHNVPLYYYEAFFTYLYGLSIFFLLYVFCYLLSGSSREPKVPKNQVFMVRLGMLS